MKKMTVLESKEKGLYYVLISAAYGDHGDGDVIVWYALIILVRKLLFMDGIVNKENYLRILNENLKERTDALGILETFQFY